MTMESKAGAYLQADLARALLGSGALGTLVNYVQRSDAIAPWTFGVRAPYGNLAQRGLLKGAQ